MSNSNKLRILVLDDDPGFVDDDGCVSLEAGCAAEASGLLRRNLELQWLYEPNQMRDYYRAVRGAALRNPERLVENFRYPHIVLFDYDLGKAAMRRAFMESDPAMLAAYVPLNPLEYKAFRDAVAEEDLDGSVWDIRAHSGNQLFQGCFAGSLIALALSDFASVGIPQTAFVGDPQTRFFEWMLSGEMQGAFLFKSQMRSSWFEFLGKALPRLRERILQSIRRGKLVPDLASFQLAEVAAPGDTQISFSSGAGLEHLRIEALFLDAFYSVSPHDLQNVEPNDLSDAWAIVEAWKDQALSAAVGADRTWNLVRAALDVAHRYQGAFVNVQHERRRKLSRAIFGAKTPEKRRAAIASHEQILSTMGVAPDALMASDAHTVRMSASGQMLFGVLDSIKAEAGDDQVARYAALALMVWAEMVWVGLTDRDQLRKQDELMDRLTADAGLEAALIERLEFDSGVLFTEGEFKELKYALHLKSLGKPSSPKSEAIVRTRLALLLQISGLDLSSPPPDEDDNPRPRSKKLTTDDMRHALVRDVMEPAPARVAFWRDLREQRGGAERPLERMGEWSLKPRDIMSGQRHPDNPFGLRRGEGRLIRLFAANCAFPERYWPLWMREGAQW